MAKLSKDSDAKLQGLPLHREGSQLSKGVLCMRKHLVLIVAFMALFTFNFGTSIYASDLTVSKYWLNSDHIGKGIISIQYDVKSNLKTKLLVTKGKDQYTYNLIAGSNHTFPLQLGNGDYTISLLEQTKGNKYRLVHKDTVRLNLNDSSVVYLNSVQNVSWNELSKAVLVAKEITRTKATDGEKVQAVYDYVTSNIKYDKQLALSNPIDYLPQIDRTFTSKKDICYGYSALFAAMLRSVDVPTKLVMGNTDYVTTYHAWNEVYLNGSWVIIDTTVDSGWMGTTTSFEMIKDSSKYTAAKQY